ncbi:MATE family efflux transporter [Leadbettera azotonutricia]|uniref:Multidrug-efflux transporter n=1 Tax=Leadbettera azotonutricia (strain ATCC BAA-888 / DSM 13862 / ZAS-9) TaxID=545695 RepID=F5Y9I1_LEAAZ|nr:MATE family efflux transporter [Leadbettera azotonutricia]AEF80423.1 MATE efflux family protein [Leadbettera azotonutricia ZAS-9]
MTKNLTVGNPALLILSFTFPLLIGNLFQQFYNMADAFIVGRTIGVEALAAVGCTGSFMFLILGFLMNFTMGTSIITSQRFGANNMQGVRRSFGSSIVLGLIVVVVLMIVSILTVRPLLRLLSTPPEIMEAAYSYIIVILWGMPASLLFNICSNSMRAVGDSVTPLIFLVIACIINIIFDYVFILVFHMGVEGAAYATIIAQLVSGLLCIPVIVQKMPILRIARTDLRLNRKEAWEHVRVGFPMGFQMSIIAIGAVTVTYALNRLGALAMAAFTASQKIDMLCSMPLMSFGTAMTTYSAQNYGARKIDRIKTGLIQCAIITCSFSVFMGLLYFFFGRFFSALFLGAEKEAVELSYTYLKINGLFYIMLAWLFISRQCLQGLGRSVVTTAAGIMELVMRIFAAITLSFFFGFTGICFASPLAWLGACIPLTISLVLVFKKLDRQSLAEKKANLYVPI